MESSVESSVLPLIILLMSNSYFAQTPDKPVLTANPETSLIFRGDTVTLTCDVQETRVTDWTYRFQCDGGNIQDTNWKEFKTTVIYSRYSGYNKCKCLAMSTSTQISTSMSNEVSFTVIDKPKPVLTVNPETSPIYRGDTVTLTCDLQGTRVTDWKYRFQCDGVYQESNEKEFKITAMNSRYRKCKCYARRTYRRIDTDWSNEVSFTVIERPKPEVRVNPDHHVFRGETVTLTCDIQTQTHTEWRYSWIKDDSVNPVSTERVYRITSDKSHSGKYSCRGEKISDSQRSDISDAVTLTVSVVSPSVSLIISPSRSQHFSSHSLSLNCEDHNNSTGWTVRRNTDSERMKDCSSTGSTCEISSLKTSDTGVYWCESQSGEHSPHINITVHDGDVILESSVHPVIEGDTLTLHCLHRSTNSSILTADFYKDGSLLQNQTTGEMSIPTVSKSHEGFYSCKHGERGQSPESWISVRDRTSTHLVIWVVVGLSVAVLLLISLILLWRYKHNKDQQCINQQTSVQNQRTRPGESPTENCPLQSGCDPIYDEVETNYKKSTGASADEVTYSELTIKNKISVDKDAGKRDVLIEMKTEDNQRGKSSECEDTVYSDLKQNTDRGGSAGVDATYAQDFNHRKKEKRKN